MARRRKLETPSAEALDKIEDEFRSETSPRPTMAPIAQVAAEAAAQSEVLGSETRAKLAEAEAYREAQGRGLVLAEIPLEQIDADALVRDRAIIDRDELTELRASIGKNGLRLPIEVFQMAEPKDGFEYGLISGYRRLMAMREAWNGTELDKYRTIKAIVREARDGAASVAAMVEENEIRAELSHFERGRIAALSAQSGTFDSVEGAVTELFPFASKAKRSKIRSFALIFEELGDLLNFPDALSERQGLRIAAALRAGAETDLRDVLARSDALDSPSEWMSLVPILEASEAGPKDPAKGGRPSNTRIRAEREKVVTARGITLSWEDQGDGYSLQARGDISPEEWQAIIDLLRRELG